MDPLLHQFQPPRSRLQRLGQLPHLLLLRQRLQADPPQIGQRAAMLCRLGNGGKSRQLWKCEGLV